MLDVIWSKCSVVNCHVMQAVTSVSKGLNISFGAMIELLGN